MPKTPPPIPEEDIDWSKAQPMTFPNLKPSTETISLRLPKWLLERIKQEANFRDVPYQSLIKVYLYDAIERQLSQYTPPADKDAKKEEA